MTDLVEILDTYCADNDIKFSYGTKANLNLLTTNEEFAEGQVFLLLDPVRRTPTLSTIGSVVGYTFSGQLLLCMQSNYDMPKYNEMANDTDRSKYILHIKPLLDVQKALINYFACQPLEVKAFNVIADGYDLMDANYDGIIIEYNIVSRGL
jgi:hypothetical protein